MCGIFGIIINKSSGISGKYIEKALHYLAISSVSRGSDSSGIIFKNELKSEFELIKGDISIKKLLKSKEFKKKLNESLNLYKTGQVFQAIGHARLVTNGSQLATENNQPVVKDGIIGIHNGIIVNVDELWKTNSQLKRKFETDTEIFLSLIRFHLNEKSDLISSIRRSMFDIEGTVSSALFFDDRYEFVLTTNNGSFYYILNKDYLVFASEEFFLKSLVTLLRIEDEKIVQLKPNTTLILNTLDVVGTLFENDKSSESNLKNMHHKKFRVKNRSIKSDHEKEMIINPASFQNMQDERYLVQLTDKDEAAIKGLKRCTRCILPETFPFIHFDVAGVCNYCLNYKLKNQVNSPQLLNQYVDPYRRPNGKADCLIPFSGGRDSTYTLHYVKKELGMNPIAFTYDWGMVTDLARRNAARVCAKLGVENIIVAADIRKKRKNIKKNIEAWLKKPHLGMVPLFMAGDKYFFYYCNKLLLQNEIEISIWGSNPLENTDFKSGFTGVSPNFEKKRIDDQKMSNKLKLSSFFLRNFIGNPAYFNSSVFDTLGAFTSRYLINRKGYLQLFDYIKWDESEIDNLIINEYNWEKSIDSPSTWRIGDGTSAFYNYIYYTVAGFSEFDTFRSNQVRIGRAHV